MNHGHFNFKHAIKAILMGALPQGMLEVMEALGLLAYARVRGACVRFMAGGAHGTQPR